MTSSHNLALAQESALERLHRFVEGRRKAGPVEDMAAFERELHEVLAAVECEIVAEELAKFDVDAPAVEVDGILHRRAVRCEETYFGAAGPVRVTRTLYRADRDEPAVCPMELRAGILEGRWTPLAAKQAAWVVAHLTPQEGEDLFRQLGGMMPSKSSLDRLPKQLGLRWETKREEYEGTVRQQEQVPKGASIVTVSLDGVMVPMKDGERQAKREQAQAEGKETRGPAGYREAGCATLSLYDEGRERLRTVRVARMPEKKKRTLKAMLTAELDAVLQQCPELEVVKLADGAKDNWEYLARELPHKGWEVVDFFHACEHLGRALAAAYGETSPKMRAQFDRLRRILLEDRNGAKKVLRSLRHLRDAFPRRAVIAEEAEYFRANQDRMAYAEMEARGLPIGSGVVEAACKTLVTQRLKRSGMRWRNDGGQAILTLRSLVQSGRFDSGWHLLSAAYKHAVTLPENVVPFKSRRAA